MLPHPGDSDLAQFMEPVARAIFGDPNRQLSTKTELRFGSHGSMKIDLAKGTAYSHEEKTGGGVLWLIEREKKLTGSAAFEFLREIGCDIPRLNGHDVRAEPGRVVASYDYTDEMDRLLFQVARFEPKTFKQRRPDPMSSGGWNYIVRGVRQVPYRLPQLIEAISNDRPVFIVEGEKDADNLAKWNIAATCNAGGAGKWPEGLTPFFRDADVIIIPDNDPQANNPETGALRWYPPDHAEFANEPVHPGQDHGELVARRLAGVARRLRILNLPNLPLKGDVSDWIAMGGTAEAFHALVTEAPPWSKRVPKIASRFGGLRWEDIGLATSPKYEWIVEDIIPKGEITLAFGDSGTGKSFAIFDMSLAIARGLSFYGKNVERGLVVYVAAEGGKGFSKRKKAYVVHHGLDDAVVPFYLMTRRPDFFSSDADCDALIAEIKALVPTYDLPLVMIVLDTVSAITPGMNENASGDVSRFRLRLQRVLDAFGVATVPIHHTPKGGSTPRGHGSFTGDFETTIQFQITEMKSKDGLPVHRGIGQKQRESKKGLAWEFTLPVTEVGLNKWGNPETSCVAVPFIGQQIGHGAGFHATPNELLFLNCLFEVLVDKSQPAPADLPISITRAADLGEVRSLMRQRMISGEDDEAKADNRFRSAFKRAADALRAGGVIGYRKPLAWYSGKPVRGLTAFVTPVEVEL